MEASSMKNKLKIYSCVAVVLLGLLCLRLVYVQLLHNEVYQTQAKENCIRLLPIKAPRGEIYARNGEILAGNELVYTLNLNFLGFDNQDSVVEKVVDLIKDYYPEVTVEFIKERIELQKYRLFEPVTVIRDIPWELVVILEENRRDLPGVAISVEPLRYYPEETCAGHVLGYIHSISSEELAQMPEAKYSVNSLIGKSGLEKQYEHELRGRNGAQRVEVDAKGRPIRELVTLEPVPGNNLYLTLDMELQKVLEKSMDATLEELQKKYPKAKVGSAVVLNVKTGEVLAMCSRPSMNPNDWRGNISSELVEYYLPQGSEYDPIKPGAALNRAIQASYPPGSTFKPITGMAALEKGLIDPLKDLVNCKGAYWLAPYIKCWDVHGNVNYYTAMAKSCNTYFQEIGRRAGEEEIIRVAGEFGLGSKTGIDLPYEVKGLLPTPGWKKERNSVLIDQKYESLRKDLEGKYTKLMQEAEDAGERAEIAEQKKKEEARLEAQYKIEYKFETNWQLFDTFNMSIGQGYNAYTVIQMASYTAAIANGGFVMKPYIVSRIASPENETVKDIAPQLVKKVDVAPETISETKRAMLEVTKPGGTAYFLFHHFPEGIEIAAKTGTAQTGRAGDDPSKEFHGVFIAFAPFDDPEIAFAGVVEYGYSGSESAGLIARDVFEQYFGIKNHLAAEEQQSQDLSNSIGE